MPLDIDQLSPEEIEQLRAYGTALTGKPIDNMQNVRHPLQAIAYMFNAAQGASALRRANYHSDLNFAGRGASRLPSVGSRIPGAGVPNFPEGDVIPAQPPQRTATAAPITPQVVTDGSRVNARFPRGRMAQSRNPLRTPQVDTGTLLPSDMGPTGSLETSPATRTSSMRTFGPSGAQDSSDPDLTERFISHTGRAPNQGERRLLIHFPNNFAITHAIATANPNASLYNVIRPFFRSSDEAVQFMQTTLFNGHRVTGSSDTPVTAGDYIRLLSGDQLELGPVEVQPNAPIRVPNLDVPDQGREGLFEIPPMRLGGPEMPPSNPLTPRGSEVTPDFSPLPNSFIATPELTREQDMRGGPSPMQNAPAAPRPIRTAQANDPSLVQTQFNGGAPGTGSTGAGGLNSGQPPAGFPASIPPDRGLEYDLGNLLAMPADERQKILERAQPRPITSHAGTAYYDPLNGRFLGFTPQQIQVPSAAGGASTSLPGHYDQQGNFRIPQVNQGGAGGAPNSGGAPSGSNPRTDPGPFPYGDMRGMQQWGTTSEIARGMGNTEAKAINDAVEAVPLARSTLSTLDVLLANTDLAGRNAFRGPGAEFMLRAKQLLSNFLSPEEINSINSLPPQEAITKIITELSSLATRQLSNRPSNFEFQSFMAAFPGLGTTQQGAHLLIDILRQIQQRNIRLGAEAGNIGPGETHRWQSVIDRVYNQNPIVLNIPAGPLLTRLGIQGSARIQSVPIGLNNDQMRQWANGLQPGTYFFYQGQLYPGGPVNSGRQNR